LWISFVIFDILNAKLKQFQLIQTKRLFLKPCV